MKKFKNVRLMLLGALVAMGSVNAFADQTNGTFTFTVSSGKATITGFAAGISEANVVIPNEVVDLTDGKKYAVVAIDDNAFKSSKAKIESFDIQAAGVTEIQAALLSGAAKLKSVTVGSGVKKIETEAFKGTALETIDLTKATSLDDLQAGAFTGTKLTALDLSATKVTSVLNYFGTKIIGDATYTMAEADAANVETIKAAGGTPSKAGDNLGTSAGTAFANYAEINEYYSKHYDNVVVWGDVAPMIPYTKATANTANATNFASQGAVKAGDNVKFTLETALAWNVANVTGAMYKGYTLDEVTAIAYNKALSTEGANKKAGDVLTASEAQAYNEKITSPTYKTGITPSGTMATNKVAKVGANASDEKGADLLYDDETAYAYNLANVPGCVKEFDESTTAFASQYDVFKWNNDNIVTPAKGTVYWPGDTNPDTKVTSYQTPAGAYAANVSAAGPKAVTTGQLKSEEERLKTAVKNETLASVKLNAIWTSIAAQAFENCAALATVDFNTATASTQVINAKAFLGTALTELNFVGTKVTSLPQDLIVDTYGAHMSSPQTVFVKENKTLTTVKFNKVIAAIPASLFENCTALKTVEFEARDIVTESAPGQPVVFKDAFNGIGSYAFANTAIEAIEVPAALDAKVAANKWAVAENAFSGCTSLKQFTYMVDNETKGIIAVVHDLAFPGCINVIYNTTNANVAAYMAYGTKAPKNTTFNIVSEDGYVTPFVTTAFKKNPNKYYIKYKAVADIQVKKDEAKVYNAYLDDTDYTLNMSLYRAQNGGYYNIVAGEVVLIITSNKDLTFETSKTSLTTGSTLGSLPNALEIVEAKEGVTRSVLDYKAGANKVIYGWVNSATAGTGFQKITTGDKFPQGTLYILAAEPADGARLNVVWRDETGAIESDPTAIESIQNVAESENGEIYNLQGVRVNGTQKGIFIKNGKKYIVK